jgi:hypothetical protein
MFMQFFTVGKPKEFLKYHKRPLMQGLGTGKRREIFYEAVGRIRRKIRLIESNVICRHLKKMTCKRDFATRVLSVCGPLRSYDPILSPLFPLTHCRLAYSILTVFTQGRGEGES